MGERPGPGRAVTTWCYGCGGDTDLDDELCQTCGMPALPGLTTYDAGEPFPYDDDAAARSAPSMPESPSSWPTAPMAPEPDPVTPATPASVPASAPAPVSVTPAKPTSESLKAAMPTAATPATEPVPQARPHSEPLAGQVDKPSPAPQPEPPSAPHPGPRIKRFRAPQSEPAAAPQPGPAGAPSSAGRRRKATVAVIVLAVLLAGVGAYLGVTRWAVPPAESAVQDYFAALADGDAAKALSHVELPAGFDISHYPLLTEPALADAGNRPKDLDVSGDGGTQTFEVTFTAGGRPVRQRVAVVRSGDRYLLDNPFVSLSVSGDQKRQLIVNGVAVTPGENTAFPGAYRVVAAGNKLFAESSVTAAPSGDGRSAKATFDTPHLADGAQANIQDAVRAKLDQCAATTADRTPHCPFWLRVVGYYPTVRWSITDYPDVTVGVASSVRFSGRSRGTVGWHLFFTSSDGRLVEQSGTLTYQVNGTATPSTTGIDVVLDET